jgi:3-phenylpropionate/cinnamic acid dioxygenase small subunit
LSDRSDVAALVHAYASRLDSGDFDGVSALFEHATWRSESTGEVLRGREEVRAVYERVRLYDGSPRTKHLISNLSIDVEPDVGRAAAECCFTVLQGVDSGDPIQIVLSGRYVDRFERVAGVWRLADRLFVVDLTGDLARHFW